MKPTILVIAFLFAVAFDSYSQCLITLKTEDGKLVDFILTSLDGRKTFPSDSLGYLSISSPDLTEYQNHDFVFSFRHDLDDEVYRVPMFARRNKRLAQYCGQTLIAEARD